MTDTPTDREADGQVGRIRIHGVDYYDEDFCRALLARAEAAEAERDAAFKALEWYADEVMAYSITQKEEPRSAVHADKGKRARAALRARADKGDG